jgi:hypothetical protein
MTELAATYVVCFFAMALAAASAFTLITMVNHFDLPEAAADPDTAPAKGKAA